MSGNRLKTKFILPRAVEHHKVRRSSGCCKNTLEETLFCKCKDRVRQTLRYNGEKNKYETNYRGHSRERYSARQGHVLFCERLLTSACCRCGRLCWFGCAKADGASIFASNLSIVFVYFIFTNKFYYISLMEQELSTNPSGLYRESPCYTV